MLALFAIILAFTFAEEQQSLCTKYSQILNLTNKQLVTAVVNGVVPKLVAANTPTKKFFDGTFPAGSTNFLAPSNAPALTALVDSLVQFFWSCFRMCRRIYFSIHWSSNGKSTR